MRSNLDEMVRTRRTFLHRARNQALEDLNDSFMESNCITCRLIKLSTRIRNCAEAALVVRLVTSNPAEVKIFSRRGADLCLTDTGVSRHAAKASLAAVMASSNSASEVS